MLLFCIFKKSKNCAVIYIQVKFLYSIWREFFLSVLVPINKEIGKYKTQQDLLFYHYMNPVADVSHGISHTEWKQRTQLRRM